MPAVFPMGPFVEFNQFLKVVNNELVPPSSPIFPALKCFFTAAFFLAINQVCFSMIITLLILKLGAPTYNMINLRDETFLSSHSGAYIYLYIQISSFFLRAQYYFGFKIAEGAAIISGLGYGGLDAKGKPIWDAACGIDVLGFEFPTSFQMSSNAWNKQVSNFLNHLLIFFTRLLCG